MLATIPQTAVSILAVNNERIDNINRKYQGHFFFSMK